MAASKGRGSLEGPPREWSGGQPAAEMQLKLQSQQEDLEQLKTELASQKVGRCEGGRTGWRLDWGRPPGSPRLGCFLLSFWGLRGRKEAAPALLVSTAAPCAQCKVRQGFGFPSIGCRA